MVHNYDFAFFGGVFPNEMINEIKSKSKGNIQYAANVLQWNIINGIESNLQTPINLFNQMFIGSYPKKYKDIRIKTKSFKHHENSEDINIGFINLILVKQLFFHLAPKKYLKNWINSNSNYKKVLFVYSANFLNTIAYVKRSSPNIHVCIILPDLPCYMNLDKQNNILYRIHNTNNQRILERNIKYIDSFVLLTEQMKDLLNFSDKPYVVIEGMIGNHNFDNNVISSEGQIKNVVYTGTLTKKYGIMDLVKAFHTIDYDDYRLVICGSGEAESEIKKYAEIDSRISFKGIVSHDESLLIQKTATILVNPRKNNEDYTKYSFPSKIIEYMATGRPVICYKLDGIPDEYDKYLIYVNDNSVKSLRDKIIEVCSMNNDDIDKIGIRNRKFVLEQKNCKKQTNKIVKMVMDAL